MPDSESIALSGRIVLSDHQYGKAENRVVRIVRDTPRHEIRDLNVSSCLRGDFENAYLTGDQGAVLPTDTQKQTAYSYAKEVGIDSPEAYALALATHYVADVTPVKQARIEVEEYAWVRAVVDGTEHDHTWVRGSAEVRTAAVTHDESGTQIVSGIKDLVVLKSTGSEFKGFLKDEYTVLEPTDDRVMATSLVAQWRLAGTDPGELGWDGVYARVREIIIAKFATVHSLALQQTLHRIGEAILEEFPSVAEVRLSAPNKHHFLYALEPFGVENKGEVFHADDRPYGLIQAALSREDAPEAGNAWVPYRGWLA
ncbi:factor-independent urate hydroxylase [Tsukamurella soli]|uniref:Uricase n=1 Tax=Tsukamurella soli TaxID=644556 RepID=A0ABP8JVK7_9ACTN